MALTTAQLAYALRITTDDTTAPDTSTTNELTRLSGVASAYVMAYASRAPENIQDEATILFVGYLYDGPPSDTGGAALRYPAAWRNSGAQGLLAPWRVRSAAALDVAAAAAGGGAAVALDVDAINALIDARLARLPMDSSTGLTRLQVLALIADWAEQGNAALIPAGKLANAPSGGGGGLTQAQVDARVAALVADWAEQGNAALIPAGKLTNAPSGGSVNVASDPAVVGLAEFEAALRHEAAIGAVTLGGTDRAGHNVPAVASRWYSMPGFWPADDGDREFVVVVTYGGSSTERRFDASALFNKVPGAAGGSASSRNAVEFSLDAPNQGTTIYIGYVTADGQGRRAAIVGIAPGLSGGALAGFAVRDSRIDVEAWARYSGDAEAIPAAKLPVIPVDKLPAIPASKLPAGATEGLTQAQVDARVRAVRALGILANRATLIAIDLQPTLAIGLSSEANIPIGDTGLTADLFYQAKGSGQQAITMRMTPAGMSAALAGYSVVVNGVTLAFASAVITEVSAGQATQALWTAAAGTIKVGDNTVLIYRPRGATVPAASATNAGRYLRSFGAVGGAAWAQVAYSEVTGTPPRLHGLRELQNGDIVGAALNLSRDLAAQIELAGTSASDRFVLAPGTHGEFHVEVSVTLSGFASSIGFDDQALTVRASGLVFATTLSAAEAFVQGGAIEGVEVAQWDVSDFTTPSAPVKQGAIHFYLARNATNQVGWVLDYRHNSGTGVGTLTADLELSFQAGDAPAASGGGGGGSGVTVVTVGATNQAGGTRGDSTLGRAFRNADFIFRGTAPDGYTLGTTTGRITFGTEAHDQGVLHALKIDIWGANPRVWTLPIDEPTEAAHGGAAAATSFDRYHDLLLADDASVVRVIRVHHRQSATEDYIELMSAGSNSWVKAGTRFTFYRIELT